MRASIKEEQPSLVSVRTGRETILVAEDNFEVKCLIREVLSQYGYTILEAVDGEDAIIKFKEHGEIDLLIFDSVMPRKNGREAYEEIIKIKPGTKVLFTSGYTRDVVLEKGIEEMEFSIISKPLTPNILLEKTREILDKHDE